MNKELWNLTVDFDLDHPRSEYGFSTRLAHENQWPERFTQETILEYKKFMYLAATSGAMVSPSEIVDIVWHQHLIFTKSYEAFCLLLGKRIEHIPSTHDRAEHEKFEAARKFTKTQYELHFGPQPQAFWEHRDLFQALKFRKSRISTQTTRWIGSVVTVAALFTAYPMLRNFFIGTDHFLFPFILTFGAAVLYLRFFNRKIVKNHLKKLDEESFIFKLDPAELIYMKKESLDDLVQVTINQLFRSKRVKLIGSKLTVPEDFECRNTREWVVKDFIQLLIRVHYRTVVARTQSKAVFQNTKQFVEKLRDEFAGSRLYMRIFSVNFAVYASIFVLGTTRLLTGISRHKPVGQLIFLLLATTVAAIYFLWEVKFVFTQKAVTSLYKERVETSPEKHNTTEWKVFIHGQAAFAAVLLPLIVYQQPSQPGANIAGSADGGGCGSGCGSGGSCGSGCGGGCGGCGS